MNGEIGHLDLTFSSLLKLFVQNLLLILNLELPYATNMTLILFSLYKVGFGFTEVPKFCYIVWYYLLQEGIH